MKQKNQNHLIDDEIVFNLKEEYECDEKLYQNNKNVKFHTSNNEFEAPFFKFIKYSRSIQEKYQIENMISEITEELGEFQTSNDIETSSIEIFFKLICEENVHIKNEHYFDLCKLCSKYKIEPLERILKRYLNEKSYDISMMLKLLMEQQKNMNDDIIYNDYISINIEEILEKHVNECLGREEFTIYRIIEGSGQDEINSDLLYDFIQKSIEERYILSQFLNIETLNEYKFEEICSNYLKSRNTGNKIFYEYFSHEILYIKTLKDTLKRTQEKYEQEINKLNFKIEHLSEKNQQTIEESNKLSQENNKLSNEIQNLKESNERLQSQINSMNQQNKIIQDENKKQGIKFTTTNQNEFQGIINYLRKKSYHSINITASSIFKGCEHNEARQPETVILYDDQEQAFVSKYESNNWIKFDFKEHRIIPTDYTIRTIKWWNKNGPHLRNWVFEGSNDDNSWDPLDHENNCSFLNGPSHVHIFKIQNQTNNAYQFIQIRQTGPNWREDDILGLDSFEIYGELI